MIIKKRIDYILLITGSLIVGCFLYFYFINPFEKNVKLQLLDGFILFVLLTLSFKKKIKNYCQVGIYGYLFFLIIQYLSMS